MPLTRLIYSVTNLPSSEEYEARWFVDGGTGFNKHLGTSDDDRNHQAPMRLEIHNSDDVADAPSQDDGSQTAEGFRRFHTRLRRPGYPENYPHPPLERSDLKRSTYLAHDDRHDPTERYAVDRSSLTDPMDQALYDYFVEDHPLDTPRHSDRI